jgi:putative component of membrane protein insertase Oxa1/YidC/SpoIIIJ protein YidD
MTVHTAALKALDRATGRRFREWRLRHKPDVMEMCEQLTTLPDNPPGNPPLVSRLVVGAIKGYQKWYSEGRDVCSFGPERNCSRLGIRAILNFGAQHGLRAIFLILLVSPHGSDGSCTLGNVCAPSPE